MWPSTLPGSIRNDIGSMIESCGGSYVTFQPLQHSILRQFNGWGENEATSVCIGY